MRTLAGSWLLVATCTGPCDGLESQVVTVSGTVDAADDLSRGSGYLQIRAFVDHADGFDIHRVYTGEQDVFMTEDPESVVYPYDFEMAGPVQEGEIYGRRWRILAWRSHDEYTNWPVPGDAFGHTSFAFNCEAHCTAEHIDVPIYDIAPPQ